jgi:hypothetical protein
VVVPLGIAAWLILRDWRVLAPLICGFCVPFGAIALYRRGAGGAIGTRGGVAIAAISFGALALSTPAGLLLDALLSRASDPTSVIAGAVLALFFCAVALTGLITGMFRRAP